MFRLKSSVTFVLWSLLINMEEGWCTIESDPGVFTQLIQELGVKGIQVEELYGLDEDLLNTLEPIYGLIFLFKWDPVVQAHSAKQTKQNAGNAPEDNMESEGVFFAQQTVQNACATQAILSILMNLSPSAFEEGSVSLGPELEYFKEIGMVLPPDLRGEAIGSNDLLRKVHNSFARPEHVYIDEAKRKSRSGLSLEDPFHFVSFMPINGKLLEFDGLQECPIVHASIAPSETWTSHAVKAIQAKIEAIQRESKSGEIRFNLMAVIRDRSGLYQKQLTENLQKIDELTALDASKHAEEIGSLQAVNAELQMRLSDEEDKMAVYRKENARRRHNYFPFIMHSLIEMAKAGDLNKYVE